MLAAGLYFDVGATITAVQVDADRRGYVVATGESADDALSRADAAARLLDVRTLRSVTGGSLLPALSGLAAVAVLVAAVALAHGVLRPRLISDTVRAQAGQVRVLYVFNEPVRALLLVNGKPATVLSALRQRGQLLWRSRRAQHYQLAHRGHRQLRPPRRRPRLATGAPQRAHVAAAQRQAVRVVALEQQLRRPPADAERVAEARRA